MFVNTSRVFLIQQQNSVVDQWVDLIQQIMKSVSEFYSLLESIILWPSFYQNADADADADAVPVLTPASCSDANTHTYTHRLTALCVLECLKNVFDLICSQALFFRSCLFYMQIMYASWTRWIIITDVISFYLSPNHFPIKTQGKVILQLPFAQCLLKDWMKSSLF